MGEQILVLMAQMESPIAGAPGSLRGHTDYLLREYGFGTLVLTANAHGFSNNTFTTEANKDYFPEVKWGSRPWS